MKPNKKNNDRSKRRDMLVKIMVAFDLLICARHSGSSRHEEEKYMKELKSYGIGVQFDKSHKQRLHFPHRKEST